MENLHATDKISIGASGWYNDHWKGEFYPQDLAKSDYLRYYSDCFSTVELGATFYQVPPAPVLIKMRDAVPDSFTFSVRANRYITHTKKLLDARISLTPFLRRIDVLGERLGPILFQLPARWSFNPKRLKLFLKDLPSDHRYAFEFRDASWFTPETYELLAAQNAAISIYQTGQRMSAEIVTADFAYIRLHGSKLNRAVFEAENLSTVSATLLKLAGEGKDVFCYCEADESVCAARAALNLKEMIQPIDGKPGQMNEPDARTKFMRKVDKVLSQGVKC